MEAQESTTTINIQSVVIEQQSHDKAINDTRYKSSVSTNSTVKPNMTGSTARGSPVNNKMTVIVRTVRVTVRHSTQ